MLYDVLQDSAGELSEYTTNLERFYGRLSTVLKQGDSIAEMHWIAQHLLVLDEEHEQRVTAYQSMLQQNQHENLKSFLKVRSNRQVIYICVQHSLVEAAFKAEQVLTSMFWVTVDKGRIVCSVAQHLMPDATIPSAELLHCLGDINTVLQSIMLSC